MGGTRMGGPCLVGEGTVETWVEGGVLGGQHMQRGDPLLLPVPALPGSFRDADALGVASPLCSEPVEMFPDAIILWGGRGEEEIAFSWWMELMVDGGWTKTSLCGVGSGKSQLLLTPELFPWDPKILPGWRGAVGGLGVSLGW